MLLMRFNAYAECRTRLARRLGHARDAQVSSRLPFIGLPDTDHAGRSSRRTSCRRRSRPPKLQRWLRLRTHGGYCLRCPGDRHRRHRNERAASRWVMDGWFPRATRMPFSRSWRPLRRRRLSTTFRPGSQTMRVLLISDVPLMRELGGGRVQLETAEELRRLGHSVETFDPYGCIPCRRPSPARTPHTHGFLGPGSLLCSRACSPTSM